MKEQKPIWVVLTIDKELVGEIGEFHVYTKQTSNKEKMIEFYKEIKQKHSKYRRVYLVTRERAKEIKEQYNKWRAEREARICKRLDKRLSSDKIATLMAREAYELSTVRK